MLAMGVGSGSLLVHLAGLVLLDRWFAERARVSSGAMWFFLSIAFVIGVFFLHLLGGLIFAAFYLATGAAGSWLDAILTALSAQPAISVSIGGDQNFGKSPVVQTIVRWATLMLSIGFLVRMERTRHKARS